MAIPSWLDAPFTWDTLIVAGKEIPGLARVRAAREYKVDKKNGAGADGATLTGLGHLPVEATITLKLWQPAQAQELQQLLPLILPKPKKGRPVPVDVSHPALAFLGVRALYFTRVGAPEPTSEKGVYEVELKGTEFLPVQNGQNVTFTAKASQSTSLTTVPVAQGIPVAGAAVPPSKNKSDTGP